MTRRRVLVIVGSSVALWCALGAPARATTGARTTADEPQYLMTALSLARDRDLDVADERADGSYRSFHEVGLPLQERIQADGSRVSPHDPLLPALLAAATAWGGWLGAKLLLAVAGGALAALMQFVAEARLGVRRAIALPVVLAASLSAPLAVYSTQVYPEILGALAVTAAIAVVTAAAPSRAYGITFGALVSVLPWLSVKYAPVALALTFVGFVRLERAARTALVAIGATGAVVFVVLHQRWYGGLTPYGVGRHFTDGQLTVVGDPDLIGRAQRLVALLVDRDFGLVPWQPLYLAAIPAFACLVRRDRRTALTLGLPLAAGWLNATFVALTMHGWWFPGRQVVVVLPCVVLGIAAAADTVKRDLRPLVWATAALGATVYAWLVAQVLITDTRLVTAFADLTHPWWRAARLLLPDGRADRPLDSALLAAWAIAIAALAAASTPFARHTRRIRRMRRVPDPIQGVLT